MAQVILGIMKMDIAILVFFLPRMGIEVRILHI